MDVELSYRVGLSKVPPSLPVFRSADEADPVPGTESLSIEDVITPEDEAELEDLDEDEDADD